MGAVMTGASSHENALREVIAILGNYIPRDGSLIDKAITVAEAVLQGSGVSEHAAGVESEKHYRDALEQLREEFSGHIMQFDDGDIVAADWITNVLDRAHPSSLLVGQEGEEKTDWLGAKTTDCICHRGQGWVCPIHGSRLSAETPATDVNADGAQGQDTCPVTFVCPHCAAPHDLTREIEAIREEQRCSTSFLQRRFKRGYHHAFAIIKALETLGYVRNIDKAGGCEITEKLLLSSPPNVAGAAQSNPKFVVAPEALEEEIAKKAADNLEYDLRRVNGIINLGGFLYPAFLAAIRKTKAEQENVFRDAIYKILAINHNDHANDFEAFAMCRDIARSAKSKAAPVHSEEAMFGAD